MKKLFYLFIFLLISNAIFCQEVIISGVNKNRSLTWDDFTGIPDQSSPYEANTYWNINYRYGGFSFNGDTVKITGLLVKLDLDGKLSWAKQGKQTVGLLKHEQGHFNIALICQNEIIKQLNTTVFFRSDFRDRIQAVFAATLDTYKLMQTKYDDETDHSKNRENQEKWNALLAKELNARSIVF